MKARVPIELETLSEASKKRLEAYYTKRLREEIDKFYCEEQRRWLKWTLVVLRLEFGFGQGRAMRFLHRWRWAHKESCKLPTMAEQDAYLAEQLSWMDYPEEWLRKVERDEW